jgi:hypothetical protein
MWNAILEGRAIVSVGSTTARIRVRKSAIAVKSDSDYTRGYYNIIGSKFRSLSG